MSHEKNIEKDKYPQPIMCGIPILPSNKNIKFTGELKTSINIFNNPENPREDRIKNQHIVEKYLVERGRCSNTNPEIVSNSKLRIFSADDEKLGTILKSSDGLNANLHDNLSCAVDAIIYEGRESGSYTPLMRERIRDWFPQLKQIGQESVEGYALSSSFSKDSNLFVIKAPRNPKTDELVHEAVVGFYALNKLRHILPNYMYIYGYTKCSPPVIKDDFTKEIITWCSSSNPSVSYLITENIRDSMSIGDFILDPNITPNDFLAAFIQLINALNLAYKKYGYTHYDLHYGNVMVRKYNTIVAIPYFGTNIDRNSYKPIGYVASRYIPYIIDYGYNTININGIGFGKIGLENFGISNTPFPMFDVYKIICFLAERLYTSAQSAHTINMLQIIDQLFSFFNEGSVKHRVIARLNNRMDYYNPNISLKSITHDNYLNWLQLQSGVTLPIHRDLGPLIDKGVFTAPINDSIDSCRFYDIISSEKGPETALEYCEVVSAINNDPLISPYNKDKYLSWLNSNFNSETYVDETLPIINRILIETNKIKNINLVNSTSIIPKLSSTSHFSTAEFVQIYKSHIYALLQIKDIISNLSSYIRSILCALTNQGKLSKYRSVIHNLTSTATEMTNFINENRQILKDNVNLAKNINWSGIRDINIRQFWITEHETLSIAV